MKPKRIWANLGVENIERTQDFYLGLGFKLNGIPARDIVSFLFGENDFVINFFENEKLKSNLEGELSDLRQGNEVIFTLSAESKEEFDQWISEIKLAEGTIFFNSNKDDKEFYRENEYHVCVFADPDGHKFNLFYSEKM